jgi:hypothetical protein
VPVNNCRPSDDMTESEPSGEQSRRQTDELSAYARIVSCVAMMTAILQ